MADLRFEWNEPKNAENTRKHKISFEEARTVFYNERALLMADPDHSENAARFVLLGMSTTLRGLVVCHCARGDRNVIRIISARRATRSEAVTYDQESRP